MIKLALLVLATLMNFTSVEAQDNKDNLIIKAANRYIKTTENQNITTLEGNVALSTQRLTVTKAEKVVLDVAKRTVIIYGVAEYSFNGKVVSTPLNEKIARIEYSLGDDTLYLK